MPPLPDAFYSSVVLRGAPIGRPPGSPAARVGRTERAREGRGSTARGVRTAAGAARGARAQRGPPQVLAEAARPGR
eukprot:15435109-Alexandrium_andersonii.AAC.1